MKPDGDALLEDLIPRIRQRLLAAGNSLASPDALDSGLEQQLRSITVEAISALLRDGSLTRLANPDTEALLRHGALSAVHAVDPAEPLAAAEVIFDELLDPLSNFIASKTGKRRDLEVARTLHQAIWRRFPPGAVAYVAILRGELEALRAKDSSQFRREVHDEIAPLVAFSMNGLYAHAEAHGCNDDEVLSITTALSRVAEMLRSGSRRDHAASHSRSLEELLSARILAITAGVVQHTLAVTGTPRPLTSHVTYELLEISSEAIRNSVQHATEMTQVTVTVHWTPQSLQISIKDNGTTAGGNAATAGIGRFTMRERAASILATIRDARTSVGYEVTLSLPLTANT